MYKFIHKLVCVSTILCTLSYNVYAGDTSNLVAAYYLNETSGTRSDSSGQGNNLTDNNTVGSASGQFGNAADFISANSEYLTSADSADWDFGTGDFSIGMYVNLDSTSGSPSFIDRNDTSDWTLFLRSTNQNLELQLEGSPSISRAWSPSTATWIHIAATRSSSTVALYEDAAQLGTTATDGTDTQGTTGIALGAFASGSAFYDGQMDDAFVFQRALSTAELEDLRDNGLQNFIEGTARNRTIIIMTAMWFGVAMLVSRYQTLVNKHRTKFGIKRSRWMEITYR